MIKYSEQLFIDILMQRTKSMEDYSLEYKMHKKDEIEGQFEYLSQLAIFYKSPQVCTIC